MIVTPYNENKNVILNVALGIEKHWTITNTQLYREKQGNKVKFYVRTKSHIIGTFSKT